MAGETVAEKRARVRAEAIAAWREHQAAREAAINEAITEERVARRAERWRRILFLSALIAALLVFLIATAPA